MEQLAAMYNGNTEVDSSGAVHMVDSNVNNYQDMHYGYDNSLSSYEYLLFSERVQNLSNAKDALDAAVEAKKKEWALGSAGYFSYAGGRKTWNDIEDMFITNYDKRNIKDVGNLFHCIKDTLQILMRDGYITTCYWDANNKIYRPTEGSAASELYDAQSRLGLWTNKYNPNASDTILFNDHGLYFLDATRYKFQTSTEAYSAIPGSDGGTVDIPKTINFGPSMKDSNGNVTYMFTATAVRGDGMNTVYSININSNEFSENDDGTNAPVYHLVGYELKKVDSNGNPVSPPTALNRFDEDGTGTQTSATWPFEMTYDQLCNQGLSIQIAYTDKDDNGNTVYPDEYYMKIEGAQDPSTWKMGSVMRMNGVSYTETGDSRVQELQNYARNLVLEWKTTIMKAIDTPAFIEIECSKDTECQKALDNYYSALHDLLFFIYYNNSKLCSETPNPPEVLGVQDHAVTALGRTFDIERLEEEGLSYIIEFSEKNGIPINNSSNEGSYGNGQGPYGVGFGLGMTPIIDIYYLDQLFNVYGEPSYGWHDTNNSDENADEKAQWYTNLFNRMSDGYKVLEKGLASSNEWIQFAFESGLVTMEQVDKSNNWQSIIYTNCSDITEETNQVAVSIAEAEYNRAMNNIENKDKKFDMELKNIDTEHNSLQQEYDSVKSVIDKNIERSFKIYS